MTPLVGEDTPTYDALMNERLAEGEWTPHELAPAYDLDDVIGRSYERAMRARHAVVTKARILARRKARRTSTTVRVLP